jgi:CheY-like chemotaxis protein
MAPTLEIMGLLRVRSCCLFTWREREYGQGPRYVEVGPGHCSECIEALRSLDPPVTMVPRSEGQEPAGRATPRRIMVIDDDVETREALSGALTDVGCEVSTFADGARALAHLRSDAPLPGLILLDLMMPGIDGYQFREEQKKDPYLDAIPVVVLTAAGLPVRVDAAKLLFKPINLDVLMGVLEVSPALPPFRLPPDPDVAGSEPAGDAELDAARRG